MIGATVHAGPYLRTHGLEQLCIQNMFSANKKISLEKKNGLL
jgi:hypothetical protein